MESIESFLPEKERTNFNKFQPSFEESGKLLVAVFKINAIPTRIISRYRVINHLQHLSSAWKYMYFTNHNQPELCISQP